MESFSITNNAQSSDDPLIARIRSLAQTINQKKSWLMGLFADTRQAAEKEAMARQTIQNCHANYKLHGVCFSLLGKLEDNPGIADNTKAMGWMIEQGYFEQVEQLGRVGVIPTPKLLDKLETYFQK